MQKNTQIQRIINITFPIPLCLFCSCVPLLQHPMLNYYNLLLPIYNSTLDLSYLFQSRPIIAFKKVYQYSPKQNKLYPQSLRWEIFHRNQPKPSIQTPLMAKLPLNKYLIVARRTITQELNLQDSYQKIQLVVNV